MPLIETSLYGDISIYWHVCGVVTVLLLLLFFRFMRRQHILFLTIAMLPGVVLHELAHLVAGILFGASPSCFSLLPKKNNTGWVMGSVQFGSVTALNAVPIALAPMALLPVAVLLYKYWFAFMEKSFVNTEILYVILFVLCFNSIPSSQDLKVACNWKSLLLYGLVFVSVIVIIFMVKFR